MKTLLSAALLAAAASSAQAQCTPTPNRFCVSFGGAGYIVNGLNRPGLTLTRGQTYTFQMVNLTAAHPFFITTSSTGGSGAGRYLNGVAPSVSVFGNQVMTFNVPMDAPDTLFYQCSVHANLGGRITIEDPPCPADFNMDGFLDFFDYDEYVSCFEDESMCHHNGADFNQDGFVDFFDYDAFVDAFEAGC